MRKILKDMKRFLIPIVVFVLLSCDNKPQGEPGVFEITDSVKNVRSVAYTWNWLSSGPRKIETEFTIDKNKLTIDSEGGATAFSLVNKTGFISDVYTYSGGKPDYNPANRLWVIEYSGDATKVKVKWSGKLVQEAGKGKSTVEVLFQVYGDWPAYSNNIRPQVEVDTLFLGSGLTEEERKDLREKARNRMIARYYNTSVDISPPADTPPESSEENEEDDENEEEELSLTISAEGEYIFPMPDDDEEEYDEGNGNTPAKTFRMQLFIRVFSNDGNSKAQYKISDGLLEIQFE